MTVRLYYDSSLLKSCITILDVTKELNTTECTLGLYDISGRRHHLVTDTVWDCEKSTIEIQYFSVKDTVVIFKF